MTANAAGGNRSLNASALDQSARGPGAPARPIAFFMRKGADCLSKWVGESERQLRMLFDQAYRMRPSIIFFDEIDGLAPVRSSRQVSCLISFDRSTFFSLIVKSRVRERG